MTVPTPAIGPALVALVAAVTAQVDDDDVLIVCGPPTLDQPDDMIIIGEQMEQEFFAHALVSDGRAGAFREEGRISVVTDVYRGGDDFAATVARCVALMAAVHAAVRTDMSLAGTVYKAEPGVNRISQLWEDGSKGPRVRCENEIAYFAVT